MKAARLAAALAVIPGALALGGCIPAYQAASGGPVAMSRTAQLETLYGRGVPVHIAPAGNRITRPEVANLAGRSAETALVYSDAWQKRQDEREARLRQSGAICRC